MNSAKCIDTVIGDIARAKPATKSTDSTTWRITADISISRHTSVAGLKRAMGIGNRRNCYDSHSA